MINYEEMLVDSKKAVFKDPKALGLCLVTGAAGFLGSNIVKSLLAQGCKVRALVNRSPLNFTHDNLDIFAGSITDKAQMEKACEGVGTIFHAAALIALMGGPFVAREYYDKAYQTNVVGTKNLLDAAVKNGIARFVYTSSVDVCFEYGNQSNMTEDMPYSVSQRSVYQQTKILAEKSVLEANGKNGLFTCAIRPGGIYGPEKNEMLDRFLDQLLKGMLVMRIGDGSSKLDVSQVDSLVHSEILAALHLGDKGTANGQAYFINDGEPTNSFEFYRPIIEDLGYKMPKLYLPGGFLIPFMLMLEFVVLKLGLGEPPLCVHAIKKVACTHWSSIAKAERDLDFKPLKTVKQSVADCMEYCRKSVLSVYDKTPETRSV